MISNKFIVLVFLATWFSVSIHAQLNIGGLIDLNLSSFGVSPRSSTEVYSSYLGFGIGAVVDWPITDQIDLHAEPMLLQKGGGVETSVIALKFKVTYLELPLMFRYNIQLNESLIPYAMAGPSIGLLTSANLVNSEGTKQNEKSATRALDFGIGVGGGIKLPKGNKTFFAEARYVLGLVNINKEVGESTVKNRGLQVVAGVTIPIDLN